MKLMRLLTPLIIAIGMFAGAAIACGGGNTAGEHASGSHKQTLSQLRRNLRAIKNNHRREKGAAKAIKKLRVAIVRRVDQCNREAKADYQLRAARARGKSRFTAGYIPRKLCT